jgi:hypothetical protein
MQFGYHRISEIKIYDTVWVHSISAIRGSACYLLHAGFIHGLVFNLEDGSDMFL